MAKRPTRAELVRVLIEAENALLDYVERLEKQGCKMGYGRSVIMRIQGVLNDEAEAVSK